MSELFDSQKLVTIAENQQKVYNAGYEKGKTESGDSRYDTFWDVYQDNGNRTNYQYAFGGHGWRQATFQPKYPLTNISNAQSMFAYARIQRLEVPLDLTNAKQTTSIFNNAIIFPFVCIVYPLGIGSPIGMNIGILAWFWEYFITSRHGTKLFNNRDLPL